MPGLISIHCPAGMIPKRSLENLILLFSISIKVLVVVKAAKAPIAASISPYGENQVAASPPSKRKNPVEPPNGPNDLSNLFLIIIYESASIGCFLLIDLIDEVFEKQDQCDYCRDCK